VVGPEKTSVSFKRIGPENDLAKSGKRKREGLLERRKERKTRFLSNKGLLTRRERRGRFEKGISTLSPRQEELRSLI